MSAIYGAIPLTKVGDGTTQVNVLNRLGGSLGTAVFTVVLQHALASRGAAGAAYGDAFRWVLGAGLLMAVPALFLIRAEAGEVAIPVERADVPSGQADRSAVTDTTVARLGPAGVGAAAPGWGKPHPGQVG